MEFLGYVPVSVFIFTLTGSCWGRSKTVWPGFISAAVAKRLFFCPSSNSRAVNLPVSGVCMKALKEEGPSSRQPSDDQVLLLLRSSKHNDSTWGLPGGSVEQNDKTFQDTAEREAVEEMGNLPAYTITASILTK